MNEHPFRFWIAVLFAVCCVSIVVWSVARGQEFIPQEPQGISPVHVFPSIRQQLTVQCDAQGGGFIWLVRNGGDVVYWWCLKFPPVVGRGKEAT